MESRGARILLRAATYVVMAFLYGDTSTGFLTLVGVFVIVPVLATAMLYLWPRTRVGKRFILPDQDATLAQMPVNLELARSIRDADDALLWQQAATDGEFQAESEEIDATFAADDPGA